LKLPLALLDLEFLQESSGLVLVLPFHLNEGVIELSFHFAAFFIESGLHQFLLQCHLLYDVFLVLVNQALLVFNHSFQLDCLSFSF
jgi:hypothetical protein